MSANPYDKLDRQVTGVAKAAIVIAVILAALAVFFIQAWALMLIVGALYLELGWFEPIGYGASCLIVLGVNIVGGIWRAAFGNRA